MSSRACGLLTLVWIAALTSGVSTHVGSPDVFFDGSAGPYRLLVAIRTPPVVPGVAGIEVRVLEGGAREVQVVPLGLTGASAEFAPVPDVATRPSEDPQFFTASLWMMASGPWQVRITLDGGGGRHSLSVPVNAVASRTLPMPASVKLVLVPLAGFLILGFIAIVGASVGQAQVEPGKEIPPSRRRRAWVSRVVAAAVVAIVLAGGNRWWTIEADTYARYIYKPLEVRASIESGWRLLLRIHDPGWLPFRVVDDLVPDHGKPVHVFVVREPDLDRLLHLHPEQTDSGAFAGDLPRSDAGRYRVFADVVHRTGFPETMVTTLEVPETGGGEPAGDDSRASADARFEPDRRVSTLADGARIVWERHDGSFQTRQPQILTFRVEDGGGQPVRDLEPYMGMAGHAVVFKRDLSVFAHLHPLGTPAMAAIALAGAAPGVPAAAPAGHAQHTRQTPQPAVVTFPYGFPTAGEYRIFVQVKRAGTVHTGVFDVRVE
jgi:hypothetical protein